MGDYTDADVGTLRVRTLPNMWHHASCDHAVTTRLLPAGLQRTAVRVTWLVHQDAVEGRDYRLEDIMPFWQLTSEQDWELCEQGSKGRQLVSLCCRGRFRPTKNTTSTRSCAGACIN